MNRVGVEGGPPEESIEQSFVSPKSIWEELIGDGNAPNVPDRLEALERMDPLSLGLLMRRVVSLPITPEIVKVIPELGSLTGKRITLRIR